MINKTRISMMALAVLAIGLFSGCTTNNSPQTPEGKEKQMIRRAVLITENATFAGGILSLKDKKNTIENRALLSGITNQLAAFSAHTNTTSAEIAAYFARLPIKELKTIEGHIIASSVIVVVDEVIGDRIMVDGSFLKPIIDAAIKGFGRAIQFGESNPYVPPIPKPPKPPRNTNAVPVR